MGGWLAAITAVFSVIALLLEAWTRVAPQVKKEISDAEVQEMRRAVNDGDAVAVSAHVDSVPQAGNPAGLGSDEDISRRLAKITGS